MRALVMALGTAGALAMAPGVGALGARIIRIPLCL